jgi:2-polyprenyl-6-methoxyphenol hydroxylase-like FAD-dependent oxidoreductase
MNLGLRDAVSLADALVHAVRENSEAQLERYAGERRAAAELVLARTDRLTRLATARNPSLRWVRNRALTLASRSERLRRRVASMLAGYA